MTVDQMIQYLKLVVNVQDPDDPASIDSYFLAMTDEDLLLFLNVAMSAFADEGVTSLDTFPEMFLKPLFMLAKKELYYTLAIKSAPDVDIGADNNNYIKESQRFSHYMQLIQQADKEYQDWLEESGLAGGILTSTDVLLSKRYFTRLNFNKGRIPVVSLGLSDITDTTVDVSWSVRLSRFYRYRVWVSENPIVDLFIFPNPVSSDAKLVATITNVHQRRCRIQGLKPETKYYVAVAAVEMSTLTGYAQEEFETMESI